MENQPDKNMVKKLDFSYGSYSYADYLTWQLDEMVELIRGKIFRQAAAPRVVHQRISGRIFYSLYNFLEGNPCEVFAAPFDVRLSPQKRMRISIPLSNRIYAWSAMRISWTNWAALAPLT